MFTEFATSLKALITKLQGWLNDIVLALPNLVLASIVLGLSIYLSKKLKPLVTNGLQRATKNDTVTGVMSNIIVAIFLSISLFLVLNILNLSDAVTALLGTAGVIGLAVGLALQDPLTNLFSGILMSVRDYYKVGDMVETNGHIGKIKLITLRSTLIDSLSGEVIIVPNKDVLQNAVKNFSINKLRRVEVTCGVAYSEDLERVKDIAVAAIESTDMYYKLKPVEFYYTDFGDSSVNFSLRFWQTNNKQTDFMQIKTEAIIAIKKAFDQNRITIPYPISTLDFGGVDGTRIDDIYPKQLFKTTSKNGHRLMAG